MVGLRETEMRVVASWDMRGVKSVECVECCGFKVSFHFDFVVWEWINGGVEDGGPRDSFTTPVVSFVLFFSSPHSSASGYGKV